MGVLAFASSSYVLLLLIMRQGYLRASDRIQPANALILGISQLWEVDDGGILEEIRRKMALSDFSISIAFWESSFYSILLIPRIRLLQAHNS